MAGLTPSDLSRALGVLGDFAAAGVAEVSASPLVHAAPDSLIAGTPKPRPPSQVTELSRMVFLGWLPLFALLLHRAADRTRRQAVGLAMLALVSYAVVAAWVVFSGRITGVLGLSDAHGVDLAALVRQGQVQAPRYHYLPPLLLLMATVLVLPTGTTWRPATRRLAVGISWTWIGVLVLASVVTVRAVRWLMVPSATVERRLRQAVVGVAPGSTVYVENDKLPIVFAPKDATLPGPAAIALLLFPDGMVDGRRVRFVERDATLLRTLQAPPPTPIANLVVGPDAGSAAAAVAPHWTEHR